MLHQCLDSRRPEGREEELRIFTLQNLFSLTDQTLDAEHRARELAAGGA